MSCKMDLARKSSKAGDLVLGFGAGTSFTVRACTVLDQHGRFLKCNVDPDVLRVAEPDPVLTFCLSGAELKF